MSTSHVPSFHRPYNLLVQERESHKHQRHMSSMPQHYLMLLLESDGGVVRQQRGGFRFAGVPRAGDISIIPAGGEGHCHSEANSRAIQIQLPPALLNEVATTTIEADQWKLSHRFAIRDEQLKSLILLLNQEAKEGQLTATKSNSLMFDSLATALAVQLLRHHTHVHEATEKVTCDLCGGLSMRAQRQVLEYIQDNLADEVRLDDIAALVGLSRYHFLRAFKASVGVTPHQYVIGQRVELAKNLMAQKRFSLRDIALRCGFSDQSHLTRQFRRQTGVTPKAYIG